MMIKKYQSGSHISINVVLPNKKNMHIAFSPLSNGKSVYITDNVDVQQAIEGHYNYGKLFKSVGVIHAPSAEKSSTVEEKDDSPQKSIVVKVTDLSDAKSYLADKFGVSRTSLKGLESIKEQGRKHGVVFEGL